MISRKIDIVVHGRFFAFDLARELIGLGHEHRLPAEEEEARHSGPDLIREEETGVAYPRLGGLRRATGGVRSKPGADCASGISATRLDRHGTRAGMPARRVSALFPPNRGGLP